MELYLYRHDEQTGPYTETDARALVASGEIEPAWLVWQEGMAGWIPLDQLIEVETPAPPQPPPPPGAPPVPAYLRSGPQPTGVATDAGSSPVPAKPMKPGALINRYGGGVLVAIGFVVWPQFALFGGEGGPAVPADVLARIKAEVENGGPQPSVTPVDIFRMPGGVTSGETNKPATGVRTEGLMGLVGTYAAAAQLLARMAVHCLRAGVDGTLWLSRMLNGSPSRCQPRMRWAAISTAWIGVRTPSVSVSTISQDSSCMRVGSRAESVAILRDFGQRCMALGQAARQHRLARSSAILAQAVDRSAWR